MAKKFLIVLAIITIASLLAGCGTAVVKHPPPVVGENELKIEVWGDENTTNVTVYFEGDESVTLAGNLVQWYYDVPENGVEYVVIIYDSNVPLSMDLHLKASSNPISNR